MLKSAAAVLAICFLECLVLNFLWPAEQPRSNISSLNALSHEIAASENEYEDAALRAGTDFVLLDSNGSVLFRSREGLPESPLGMISAGGFVLPVKTGSGTDAILLMPPSDADSSYDLVHTLAFGCIVVSGAVMLFFALILDRGILKPFRDLKSTAERIAGGDFSTPLRMDRRGVFGAFTESLDLMRTELAHSQAAEARASAEKKELIAKLSHDLRTPIASIQAVSELGALAGCDKDRRYFEQTSAKAVQLNLLVSNLLNASMQDDTELAVAVRPVDTTELCTLLKAADYRNWLTVRSMPDCSFVADPVRLQQVADNVMENAYKYGSQPVTAAGYLMDGELIIEIEDSGGGVRLDEEGSLHLKLFRGENSKDMPGAGLGLYICDQLMKAMNGELIIRNGSSGLLVTLMMRLARSTKSLRKS